MKNAKSSFFQRINNQIASYQAGSRSRNFCQSNCPRLKNLALLQHAFLEGQPFASIFACNSNMAHQGYREFSVERQTKDVWILFMVFNNVLSIFSFSFLLYSARSGENVVITVFQGFVRVQKQFIFSYP